MREDRYLSEQELADRYRRSISTIRRWRKEHFGPPHIALGPRLIAYRLSAIEAWEATRTNHGADQVAA